MRSMAVMSFKNVNKMACQLRICIKMASEGQGVGIFFKSGNNSACISTFEIP
jgi:hypothetical protein